MPWRFALYYIPAASQPLYTLGSQILGYDVRQGNALTASAELRQQLGEWPAAWVARSSPFGFHLTVTEALSPKQDTPEFLEAIAACIADTLGCFDPQQPKTLHYCGLEHWRDGEVWVLRYRASEALQVLQAVMVSQLASYGKDSLFFDEIAKYPERYSQAYQRQRLKTFLSPRGLDSWQPHFTLFNPFACDDAARRDALRKSLEQQLSSLETNFCVDSLCLMHQDQDQAWQIVREFPLAST